MLVVFALAPTAQARTSTVYDFNTDSDLANFFNGQGPGAASVTQATDGGIGNSGSIRVPLSSVNAVFTSKEGYSLGPVGSTYTFSTFLKSEGNSGYSGVGFTIKTPADASTSIAYRPDDAFGISVHGGGFIFHNGSTNYSGSWSSTSPGNGITAVTASTSCSDLINNTTSCGSPDKWFQIVFIVERTTESEFDLRVEVWPSDADGSLRFETASAVFERNAVTNANILAAPQLFSYFSFSGTRVTRFDEYSIGLAGGATAIAPGAPVVLTESVQVVGNPTVSLAGRVTFDGGNAVAERGFVYGTRPTPTTADTKITIGAGTGAFSGTTALPATGTYYFRSFASNATATAYGSEVSINYVASSPGPPLPGSNPSFEPSPSPVAQQGGGIPVTPPGVTTGSIGGVPTPPTPSRPSGGAAEFRVGTVETRVDVASSGAGRVGGTGSAPVIQAVRDRVATVSGSGMRPGGIAEVWLPLPNGGSRQVALLPIGPDGRFDGALPFTGELDGLGPLPIGDRTIQLFGVDANGQLTVINFGVRIQQPGPIAPEPDRGRGVVPALTPGQSLATNAGVPTPVTVTPIPDARSTRIEGDGWLMDVDVPEGTVRDEGGAPLIEIENGTDSVVRGTGFMPGTRAYVWLMSDPTFLGEVTVRADGSFSGSVPLDGVAAGQHTLQLSGVGTDGFVRAANLGVVLVGDGMPRPTRVPAGDGPLRVPGGVLLWLAGLASVAAVARGRVRVAQHQR